MSPAATRLAPPSLGPRPATVFSPLPAAPDGVPVRGEGPPLGHGPGGQLHRPRYRSTGSLAEYTTNRKISGQMPSLCAAFSGPESGQSECGASCPRGSFETDTFRSRRTRSTRYAVAASSAMRPSRRSATREAAASTATSTTSGVRVCSHRNLQIPGTAARIDVPAVSKALLLVTWCTSSR